MIGVLIQSGGDLTAIAEGVNIVWVMIASFLIFFVQPGFALLYCRSEVREILRDRTR